MWVLVKKCQSMKKVFQYCFFSTYSGPVYWLFLLADLQPVVLRQFLFSSQYLVSNLFVRCFLLFFCVCDFSPYVVISTFFHIFPFGWTRRKALGRNKFFFFFINRVCLNFWLPQNLENWKSMEKAIVFFSELQTDFLTYVFVSCVKQIFIVTRKAVVFSFVLFVLFVFFPFPFHS